jgi:hypothetical protein
MSQQPPWQPQQPPNNQPQWSQQVPPQYQQSFYNQPTQATPGQFQQTSYNNFPPPRKPGLWTWFKSRTRNVKLSIGCGTILALLLFFSCIGIAIGRVNLSPHSHQAATDQTFTSTSVQTPTTHPPAPGGYLASGSNYVLFIQFTNTNGTLSGEWNEADVVTNTSKNMLQVSPFHTSFSAYLDGTQFNLDVSGHTYAGSFDGNNVTIEFPQQDGTLAPITLTPASIDDYNNAITNVQNTVNQENQNTADAQATASTLAATATATTDEQNRLNYDLANIGGAINSLQSDADFSSILKRYSNEITQMQRDYQQEQSDANGGCANYGTVGVDDGTVQVDQGTIQTIDGSLQVQISSMQSDNANVEDFLQKIQQHWNNLGKVAPNVSQNDINTAIQNGTNAVNQGKSNLQSAQNQASGFDNQAKQIVGQADSLYNNMHC